MDEQLEPPGEETPEELKQTRTWLITGIVAAVAAGILLASSVWTGEWKSNGNYVGNELVENKAGVDPQSWCAAQSTYDAIRRELFRRAAQAGGRDEQAFARLSDFAMLRMNGPVLRGIDDRLRAVACSGSASLDLPPGVSVSDRRSSLSGDVDYIVQAAADGSGMVVRLGNADAITIPLATVPAQMIRAPALAEMARERANGSGLENASSTQLPPTGNDEQSAVPNFNEVEGTPPPPERQEPAINNIGQ
jgi:hypothetical protein